MKKTNKNTSTGMALGMCFGVSIGTSIGSSLGNIAMGSSMGMLVGMVIGLLIGAAKDKEVNNQIEEKGYTIKDIKKNEQNGEYIITIVNNGRMTSLKNLLHGAAKCKHFAIATRVNSSHSRKDSCIHADARIIALDAFLLGAYDIK